MCFAVTTPTYSQVTPANSELNIIVTEGQGAINNIRQQTGRTMAVRIQDENQQPIAGVPVVFTLPSQGPGGSFLNDQKTLIVNTDAQGIAFARGLKPNKVAGKFEVRVSASHQNRTSSTVITQFNMTVQNASGKGGKGKWVAIALAAGGAAAAGVALGARGSSTTAVSPPPGPATISISAGSGSVGPPQ